MDQPNDACDIVMQAGDEDDEDEEEEEEEEEEEDIAVAEWLISGDCDANFSFI